MAALRAASRCCRAAHRAALEAGVVGNHPTIPWRFMSSAVVDKEHPPGFSAHGDEPSSVGTCGSGKNSEPSANMNLQKALEVVKQLDLNESEREIFLKAVDIKFSLYKSPAEVAKGIRSMELKSMAEMTWLLEAMYVKCGPWIYVIDHQLKKRGIKEEPDFTMDEYEKSPGECRTELKIGRLLSSQALTNKILGDMSKLMSRMEKPPVPMFSITIGGRTIFG